MMPLYDYRCPTCKKTDSLFAKVDDRDNAQTCPKCGGGMARMLNAQFGINMGVGPYGYYDENLNTYIHTNAHKCRVMQEQGVQEKYGKGWR